RILRGGIVRSWLRVVIVERVPIGRKVGIAPTVPRPERIAGPAVEPEETVVAMVPIVVAPMIAVVPATIPAATAVVTAVRRVIRHRARTTAALARSGGNRGDRSHSSRLVRYAMGKPLGRAGQAPTSWAGGSGSR